MKKIILILSALFSLSGFAASNVNKSFSYRETLSLRADSVGNELKDGDVFTSFTTEGIEMTFKVISAAEKTCQVGSGSPGSAMSRGVEGKVTIPSEVQGYKVTAISYAAFYACHFNELVFPTLLETIDIYALGGCNNLSKIVIPASVTTVHPLAFGGDSKLKEIVLEDGNNSYCSQNGMLLNKDRSKLVIFPPGFNGVYTVDDYIEEIGDYSFILI